jgi:hypothetical protein
MKRPRFAQKLSPFAAARKVCGSGSRSRRCCAALAKHQPGHGQDDRSFMFDHIRMIARRNGAARPFIVLGDLGWALWRTGYDEISGSIGHRCGADRGTGFAAGRRRARAAQERAAEGRAGRKTCRACGTASAARGATCSGRRTARTGSKAGASGTSRPGRARSATTSGSARDRAAAGGPAACRATTPASPGGQSPARAFRAAAGTPATARRRAPAAGSATGAIQG